MYLSLVAVYLSTLLIIDYLMSDRSVFNFELENTQNKNAERLVDVVILCLVCLDRDHH